MIKIPQVYIIDKQNHKLDCIFRD